MTQIKERRNEKKELFKPPRESHKKHVMNKKSPKASPELSPSSSQGNLICLTLSCPLNNDKLDQASPTKNAIVLLTSEQANLLAVWFACITIGLLPFPTRRKSFSQSRPYGWHPERCQVVPQMQLRISMWQVSPYFGVPESESASSQILPSLQTSQ